jgi:hypothetical protein
MLAALALVGCDGTIGAAPGSEPDGGSTTNLPDGTTPTEPTPEPPAGNDLEQDALFTCDGEPGASPARLRRIGRREWVRAAGYPGEQADNNPFDPLPHHPFSTYAEDETLNLSILDIYLGMVGSSARGWNHHNQYRNGALATVLQEESIQCFFDDAVRPNAACTDSFVRYLLERGVLHRPAKADEVEHLTSFAEAALDGEIAAGSPREDTVTDVVSAAWMTTGALFRGEWGQPEADEEGRHRLTDWELAHAIAYALDGRAPGTPSIRVKDPTGRAHSTYTGSGGQAGHLPLIAQAAQDGSISDPEMIAELVHRYFGGVDEYREDLLAEGYNGHHGFGGEYEGLPVRGEFWLANGVRAFFREWLGYPGLLTQPAKADIAATSAFEEEPWVDISYGNMVSRWSGDEPDLVEQMDDMVARIVASDEQVFSELLISRTFYTPATADYYGSNIQKSTSKTSFVYNVTERTGHSREERWKTLPADERAGVLTHPAWLGAHALSFENDPNMVHRGKWIREELLCDDVPDLPITVDAQLDPDTKDQSARHRMYDQVESKAECNACHQLMNPLGHPFEIYNHAGFLRETDHGQPPDGSTMLEGMPDPALDGPIRDAVELSEKLAASDHAKRCFIRQAFRHFMGRDERPEDRCALTAMEVAYDESGGSFSDMLIALFTSDAFQYRVYEE